MTAVGIKRLWYADISAATSDLDGSAVYEIIKAETTKEVKNIHQDTWNIEESDASQTFYKNQLTGTNYRSGDKTMGDVTFNWTIGKYDYPTKADFLGGTATATSWKRARGIVEIEKLLIALTIDGQYCVLPRASIRARESNTDKAIGLAIVGTMVEPEKSEIAPEYWFDESEVVQKA